MKKNDSVRKVKTMPERFWPKVSKSDGCWLWVGGNDCYGYGTIKNQTFHPDFSKSQSLKAHRVSYELHYGAIEIGMSVLHKSDVRLCVNPDHLFLGTSSDNVADMVSKGRQKTGEQLPFTKLKSSDVREIRSSNEVQQVLADRYGVAQSAISNVKRNITHRSVV